LLKRICKCKGTQKYVHESCLIRWLNQRGTDKCEVCLQKYNISYELGSVKELLINTYKIFFGDNNRILRGCLYALYLFIFFKRFIQMIESIFKNGRHIVANIAKFVWRQLMRPRKELTGIQSIANSPHQ